MLGEAEVVALIRKAKDCFLYLCAIESGMESGAMESGAMESGAIESGAMEMRSSQGRLGG